MPVLPESTHSGHRPNEKQQQHSDQLEDVKRIIAFIIEVASAHCVQSASGNAMVLPCKLIELTDLDGAIMSIREIIFCSVGWGIRVCPLERAVRSPLL